MFSTKPGIAIDHSGAAKQAIHIFKKMLLNSPTPQARNILQNVYDSKTKVNSKKT